jgi:hypothetical protein
MISNYRQRLPAASHWEPNQNTNIETLLEHPSSRPDLLHHTETRALYGQGATISHYRNDPSVHVCGAACVQVRVDNCQGERGQHFSSKYKIMTD